MLGADTEDAALGDDDLQDSAGPEIDREVADLDRKSVV